MNRSTTKTPVHLWIVGILSLLWNACGAFDYTATQYRLESYMSQFTPEQLDYFYAFPAWADAAGQSGFGARCWDRSSCCCAKRLPSGYSASRSSAWPATSVYNFLLTDGASMMGEGAVMFTAVIWAIALFLYFYSSAMTKRRVLG